MNYAKVYKNLSPIVKWAYRITVVGQENIPEGGAIIAANHTAFSDPILISAAAVRQVRYMSKKELFKTPLAPLIKLFGAFPVDRSGSDVGAVKTTIKLIEEGELVGIFPQGTRQPKKDPRTTEVKSGIGMFAYYTKAPIVPAFIDNKRGKTGIFMKHTVTFGKPVTFEELAYEKGGRAEYTRASRMIFDRVCELKYGRSEVQA